MRFSLASFVVLAFASVWADVARAAAPTPECLRACDIAMAKRFEDLVRWYPDSKNLERLHHYSAMKLSLSSALLIALCTLAALTTTTEASLRVCTDKCEHKLSKDAERCIKKHPVTDSDGRLDCNKAIVVVQNKCSKRCKDIWEPCFMKCANKAHRDFEPCILSHEDYKNPERIKCIKAVEAIWHQCYNRCAY
ncbi:hypothetical protein DFQ26_009332 [Actinomortierella ambigua]|nr:hypothetical protein DFQ26_009332 [Actinomortierella ambigua]